MDVDDSVMDIDDDADANDARRHGSPTPLKPRKPSVFVLLATVPVLTAR